MDFAEFLEDNVYELEGIKYRVIKKMDSGIIKFQELDLNGCDLKSYYLNSDGHETSIEDWGIRLIKNRLSEMTKCVNILKQLELF